MTKRKSQFVRVELDPIITHSLRVIMPKQPDEIFAKTFTVSFSDEGIFISSTDGIAIRYHKHNAILIIHPTE